jgi:hypothetical protein
MRSTFVATLLEGESDTDSLAFEEFATALSKTRILGVPLKVPGLGIVQELQWRANEATKRKKQ